MKLADGRFWAQTQDDDLTARIPPDMALAAIRTLAAHDALDLAPMLLAPLKPTAGRKIK